MSFQVDYEALALWAKTAYNRGWLHPKEAKALRDECERLREGIRVQAEKIDQLQAALEQAEKGSIW